MYELSLFSGAGGGLLGTHLLGWRPVGYVEINDYCQRIIAARIRDGILPNAPIFGDINAFNRDGYAAGYSGLVDVVTAGFPCQPFSVAGKRRGADDDRNGWPATIECVRLVQPRYVFLENVPGLLNSGYFRTVLGDLAESGYDCRWRVLSAAEVGAPHRRDRLWIVCHSQRGGQSRIDGRRAGAKSAHRRAGVADASSTRLSQPERQRQHGGPVAERGWWAVEPDVDRVANGVAARVDRLKAIGNGQVPAVVAAAWLLLTEE